MPLLSVILPAYNEELMIHKACDRIAAVLAEAGIRYELLFVDDGSADGTWKAVTKEALADERVRGIRFSRNFGKESAIFAGLSEAAGDAVVVIDCDLQHPPEKIPEMYALWQQGYQVVEGLKSTRGRESRTYGFFAGLFYRILSRTSGIDMARASDFKLLDRTVVQAILSMPERNMFFRATSSWVGYRSTSVPFDVQDRENDSSTWNTRSLVQYAVNDIVSYTAAPLQIVTAAGIICFICSVLLGIYSLVQYFAGHAVEGYSTLLIVLLMTGSGIMLSLGIIGCYIARIYEEVKNRPRYLISEKTDAESKRRSINHEKVDKDIL